MEDKTNISDIRNDIKKLKDNVSDIKKDVFEIKSKILNLETEINKIKKLLQKANEYGSIDPSSSLNKSRQATEVLCKSICNYFNFSQKHNGMPVTKLKLDEMLKFLKNQIPNNINILLNTAQNLGNWGSHDQNIDEMPGTPKEASICIESIKAVTEWYCSEQGITFDFFDEPKPDNKKIINHNEKHIDKNIKDSSQKIAASNIVKFQNIIHSTTFNNDNVSDYRIKEFLKRMPYDKSNTIFNLVDKFHKEKFKLISSPKGLCLKLPNNDLPDLWQITLLLFNNEGTVEFIPKWIIPHLAKYFNDFESSEKLVSIIKEALEPYKVTPQRINLINPPLFNHNCYDFSGNEDKIVNIMKELNRKILSKIKNNEPTCNFDCKPEILK